MLSQIIRARMNQTIKYIEPSAYRNVTELAAQVYAQIEAETLPVPPLVLHAPRPELLAGAWSILRESLRTGQVSRSLKETVATTVSQTNECPYCVDVHSSMLHAMNAHDAADAILQKQYDRVDDPELHAVVRWVLDSRTSNGTCTAHLPFAGDAIAEIIGTAVTFHYINRMVNVFLTKSPFGALSAARGVASRLFGATAGKHFLQEARNRPGDSLKLLPDAPLPDDLAWAAPKPTVAGAFARFAAVVEEAGHSVLAEPVRGLASEQIQAWTGESMGVSRQWVEHAVAQVEAKERTAARLVLLTALASYQVDERIVESFREQYPADNQLVGAVAWASFTAARRIGRWLALPNACA